MDLYQKNQQCLRKLLAKRQNPCNQIFTCQPLNSTSQPTTAVNLQPAVPNCHSNHLQQPQIIHTSNFTVIITQDPNSSNTVSSQSDTLICPEEDDENGEIKDKLQKKIRLCTSDGLNRKSSYEEEREESTSCETHSEGSNEIPDFFLSPMMQAQRGKGSVLEFKLDDDLCSNSFLSSSCDEELNCLKEARTYAMLNQGTCCTVDSLQSNGKIKFKCRFNHQWATKFDEMRMKWCPRCDELLKDYQGFAKQNGGRCMNQNFEESIKFACHQGHFWQLNHKNAKKRWCLDCIKEERNNMRKKCEEERAQREKEEEEYQKRLFEEAKRKAMEDAQINNNKRLSQNSFTPQSVLEYFQKMDYEVEKLAQKYTVEFMSQKEFTGDISYQQILQVYKILIMPEEILQNYMGSLNSETLKSEFRRFAKIIHPDKNKHPRSGTAFQRIYKVYEVALARIETAQKI